MNDLPDYQIDGVNYIFLTSAKEGPPARLVMAGELTISSPAISQFTGTISPPAYREQALTKTTPMVKLG